MKPTVAIILDTRKMTTTGSNTGRYHIKIRVTFCIHNSQGKKWTQKYYKTGYFATPNEYEVIMGKPRSEDMKGIRLKIKQLEAKALDIIEHEIEDMATFEVHYLSTGSVREIDGLFNKKIKDLEDEMKISTAEKYATALKVIHEFGGEHVSFGEINLKWLKRFQAWYTAPHTKLNRKGKTVKVAGRSIASFAFHCRALRHIFKTAIDLRIIEPSIYPFGPTRFAIPSMRRAIKRYFTPEEKDKFLEYHSEDDRLNAHRDFWVFSYFCSGMNFADIAYLKRRDVYPEYIMIDRHKTLNTDPNKKKLIIPLRPEVKEIIARRGNPTLNPEDYVFPILKEGMTPRERFKEIRKFVMRTNKGLKSIQKDLGFPDRITTYTARHTFSNIIMLAGASTEILQDALGHADKQTTEYYKAGFSLDVKKKYSEAL